MAELFGKKSKESNLQTKYNSSISNLLIVVAFSVVNIVLLLTNANSYFLFSAFVPYYIADYGMYFCGMYPEEYYADVPDMVFEDKSFLAFTVAISAVILLIYLLCWFFAKKKKIWAVFVALVLFVLDTAAMLLISGFSADSIFDILIHVWVIYYLITAIVTYKKLKNEPDPGLSPNEFYDENAASESGMPVNSNVLRMAEDVKCRVFLEAEHSGMHIVYRRVKRTNELVINGCVYDEYEALVEAPHTLTAFVNGHKIEALIDASSRMRLLVDSEEIAKKMRLV